MEKIRVLQVFTVLNIGGAEVNLINYYRKLPKDKIQMDFLVHRDVGFFEKEILESGSNIYRLPPIHPLKLKAYKQAVALFFKEHASYYDVLHGQLSELGVFIYESAKKYGIPVRIAHAHNSKMDFDLKGPFRYWWKKRMLKSINAYFSCGQESSVWLFGKKIANKAFIMPNSIDLEKFKFDSNVKEKYKKEFNFSTPFIFLHVGRFSTQKNHTLLIDIFSEILKKLPDAKLLLVGEGELKGKIEAQVENLQISDAVIFLGRRLDVNQLMQYCSYFIFPSLFEGFSIAMIEAQASGMYCFISDGIPQESILIPENVTVLSLKRKPDVLALQVIENAAQKREKDKDVILKIKKSGCDVSDNVTLLLEEYQKLLRENGK